MSRLASFTLLSAPFVVATVAAPAIALGSAAPDADAGLLLVIGADAAELARSAGGSPIGPWQAPFGTLAAAPPEHAAGFAQRLSDAGAWIVLDGAAAAAICGARP